MEASIMKLTKLVALLLVVCMTACMFISCKPQDDGKLKIGILQLAPHPALDAATEGFKQVIIENTAKKMWSLFLLTRKVTATLALLRLPTSYPKRST